MLSLLRIKNFAIIEEMEVEFSAGLNVLTGETGAGKSVILKAIDLLSGRRAKSDLIRLGSDKAIIEGLFILDKKNIEKLKNVSDEMEALIDDEQLLIRRIIDSKGKGKIYLNGSLITASSLSHIACALIDITGQHQQQSLLNSSEHRPMLDRFGVKQKLLDENAKRFSEFALAQKNLKQFKEDQDSLRRKFDTLSTELEELNKAELKGNERDELETNIARASNIETIGGQIDESIELLSEGEHSALDTLRKISFNVEQCCDIDESLNETKEFFDNARVQLEEALFALNGHQSKLQLEPETLEHWRSRLAEIARLSRKYQRDELELVAHRDALEKEVSELESSGFDEKDLEERFEKCRSALNETESQLSEERKKVASKLIKKTSTSLKALGMKDANFGVSITPGTSNPFGADNVDFTLAANLGEGSKPLAKVASGGELSRVLLVLKTLLSKTSSLTPSTQVFDEIDTGVGGKVARLVGEKLKEVSSFSQVILITHSPQIASLADTHLFVQKTSKNKRTTSGVRILNEKEKIESIVSMMGGEPGSSEFVASAKKLINPEAFN